MPLILSLLLLLVLLTVVLMLRAQKRKQRQRKQELEMESLYSQMNPHFVFNALGSIQGLMNDNRIDLANQYLFGFASLLRNSITDGRKSTVPLRSDLAALDNYIALERLRNDFEYRFEIDESLKTSDLELPPLLVQPLIENAIKHGLKGRKGLLEFLVKKDNADLLMIVTDNGDGYDSSEAVAGQGISLTRQRIALFNGMHKGRLITLDLTSAPGRTRAVLRFNNWLIND